MSGNAHTEMAAGHQSAALQPDGTMKAEGTFDVKHVADMILHIAELPLDVTVLTFNIMYVSADPESASTHACLRRASTMPFVGRG